MERPRIALAVLRACTFGCSLLLPASALAQNMGSWSQTYDWSEQLFRRDANGAFLCPDNEKEISHAALIPTGPWRGAVLLWHAQMGFDEGSGPDCGLFDNTSTTYLFDPGDPDELITIPSDFSSDIFCAGQSWDPLGQLVAAGGVPGGGSETTPAEPPFPPETYQFRPKFISSNVVENQWGVPVVAQSIYGAWKQIGSMALERYYPTQLTLSDHTLYFSDDGPIAAGSMFVHGGPPLVQNDEGNEFWEVLEPKLATANPDWEKPFVPEAPESTAPHYDPVAHATHDEYLRIESGSPPEIPERLLDSYPRTIQMSNGDLLIAGDVDTGLTPPVVNEPGRTWVIKPRADTSGLQDNWELYYGREGQAPSGASLWHDSFYDNVVLIQEPDGFGVWKERVLMFGGSRFDDEGAGSQWLVNDEVWEFVPSTTMGGEILDGTWEHKTTDARFQRVWSNAVILPTRDIFVVGGSSTDGGNGHCAASSTPVDTPILYDIGSDATAPGTIRDMAMNQEVPGAMGLEHTPRLYHSVATLLPDGRVLVAGGRLRTEKTGSSCGPVLNSAEPRYTGEVFSPPYLSSSVPRPIIDSIESPVITFNSTFEVQVTHSDLTSVEDVVLMRPAAVTHHFDNDQRYTRLPRTIQFGTPSGGTVTDTLTVTAPTDRVVPPGYYMLFVLVTDGSGLEGHRVPSVAEFVRLKS